MDSELENMWKEAGVDYFKPLSQHFSGYEAGVLTVRQQCTVLLIVRTSDVERNCFC
jgi:hypothetical protein